MSDQEDELVVSLGRGARPDPDRVSWAGHRVQPQGQYVSPSDFLEFSFVSSVASQTLAVQGLFQPIDGEPAPFRFTVATTSDRVVNVQRFPMGEGFIVCVTVTNETTAGTWGSSWAAVRVVRGAQGTPLTIATLVSGAITNRQRVSWPSGDAQSPLSASGGIQSIAGTDPAAGAEVSEAVPAGARWRLISVRAQLVASAVAANRRVHLIIDDGANTLMELAAADLVTAGLTRNFNFTKDGYARATQDNEIYVPLPGGIVLAPGFRIRTSTTALDVGDNWGVPRLYVEEWLTT